MITTRLNIFALLVNSLSGIVVQLEKDNGNKVGDSKDHIRSLGQFSAEALNSSDLIERLIVPSPFGRTLCQFEI